MNPADYIYLYQQNGESEVQEEFNEYPDIKIVGGSPRSLNYGNNIIGGVSQNGNLDQQVNRMNYE